MDGDIKREDTPGNVFVDTMIKHDGLDNSEQNNDMISTFSSTQSVTAEEARQGIIKVIHYLQAKPPDEGFQMQMLLKILDYINKQAKGSDVSESEPDDNLITEPLFWHMINEDPVQEDVDELNGDIMQTILDGELDLDNSETKNGISDTSKSSSQIEHSNIGLVYDKADRKRIQTTDTHYRVEQSHNFNLYGKRNRRKKTEHTPDIQPKTRQTRRQKQCVKFTEAQESVTDRQKQVYQCRVCYARFDNPRQRWHHMESHRDYMCKECGRRCSCKAGLVKHMKTHSNKLQLHTCQYCKQGFEQPEQLTEHIKIHSGVEPFVCTTCHVTFSRSRDLSTHMMIHADDRPYKCTLCDKAYKHQTGLRVHKQTHEGTKEHMCSMCGKCFIASSELQKHLPVHTNEKKYVCEICDKAFTHYSGLFIHAKRHTGERPFTCNVCDKSFVTTTSLTYHMRVHTGEKPHVCDTCGKQFTSGSNLRRHEVVHTGAKPYACALCGAVFTQSTTRKTHMNKVHGQAGDVPMKLCDYQAKGNTDA